MLRIFLTVSVLFWNQLAAQNAVKEMIELCEQDDCPEPAVVIEDKNYEEMEYRFRQWIQTEVHAVNFKSAMEIGLGKLFNYSRCGNVAGTVVPVSGPWGVFGYLQNGEIQQRFTVYLLIVSEVIDPPEPTDPTVKIVFAPPVWYFARDFDKKVDEQQIEERVIQFQKDLEQDNQPFNRTFFVIAFFNTHGLIGIGFEKAGE
ncbi:heme-binding protein 2-like [Scyliorhinus torazame]|uniref:heme-binding protein 2-like n=1 Tax=Scyliorhinus torazame TaxID=75743 RepID=UPI003B5AE5D3